MAKSNGKTTVANMPVRITLVSAKEIIQESTVLGMSAMRWGAKTKRKTTVLTAANTNAPIDGVLLQQPPCLITVLFTMMISFIIVAVVILSAYSD